MARVVRSSLLGMGNGKLGESIAHFSIPAIETCRAGSTALCRSLCYARTGRFGSPQVQKRLQWSYEQSLRDDFSQRMIGEIRRRGVMTVRVHVAGDFYHQRYALKWEEVMSSCSHVTFFFYTRAWRSAPIRRVLEAIALLPNVFVWYSRDRETGNVGAVPERVRLAWLMSEPEEVLGEHHLVFADYPLRASQASLPLLCPHEAGIEDNCGTCQFCFRP